MSDARLDNARQRLAELGEQGAERYDPVRFRYLESLARRGASATLQRRLAAFERDLERAREAAEVLLSTASPDDVHGQRLRALLNAGDYKAVRRLATRSAAASPLADLTRRLREQDDTASAGEHTDSLEALLRARHQQLRADQRGEHQAPRRQLKALASLRASHARQHTARRIRHAMEHPTGDAGPLNAHRQVVRALDRLHGIAPGYLERFVGYVDTLMALEKAAPKNSGGRDSSG